MLLETTFVECGQNTIIKTLVLVILTIQKQAPWFQSCIKDLCCLAFTKDIYAPLYVLTFLLWCYFPFIPVLPSRCANKPINHILSLLGFLRVPLIAQVAVPGSRHPRPLELPENSSNPTFRETRARGFEAASHQSTQSGTKKVKRWLSGWYEQQARTEKKVWTLEKENTGIENFLKLHVLSWNGLVSLGLKAPGLSLYLGINFTRALHWFNYRKTEPIDSFSWLQVNLQKNGTKPALDFIQAKSAKEPSQGQNQRCYG